MTFTKLISVFVALSLFSAIFAESMDETDRSGWKTCDKKCYPLKFKWNVYKYCPKEYGTVVGCTYKVNYVCKDKRYKKVCKKVYIKGYKCICQKPSPSPSSSASTTPTATASPTSSASTTSTATASPTSSPSSTSSATPTPTPTSSVSASPSPVCKPTHYYGRKGRFVTRFVISNYDGKVPFAYTTKGPVKISIFYRGNRIYSVFNKGYAKKKGVLTFKPRSADRIKLVITGKKRSSHWNFVFGCPKHY